jgi:hypothetical protein
MQALRAMVDLAPDTRLRFDHIRHAGRRSLVASTWVGTREGGAFEDPKIIVSELDETGRFRRMDQYELDQHDAALARSTSWRPSCRQRDPRSNCRERRSTRAPRARTPRRRTPLAWMLPSRTGMSTRFPPYSLILRPSTIPPHDVGPTGISQHGTRCSVLET